MTEKEKWIFIVNPVAGNGFAEKYATEVKTMIEKKNIPADIVFTERKGHATQIAKEYADKGYTYFISVGGDGTFSEKTQSLVNRDNIILGLIPAGTGNDFASLLGFSARFSEKDWEIFFEKQTVKMDVGKCNDRFFVNGMGLGFDARVAAENYQPGDGVKVKKGSKSKYWWHIIKTLLVYREEEMVVTQDGEAIKKKAFLNTIANGRRLAGGFYLTPDAIANDGFLNICMIQELKLMGRLKAFARVIQQKHTTDEVVNYFQTNHISFQFDRELPAHLDGELYFNTTFDVSIFPSALNVIYNPEGKHYFNL